MGDAGKRLIGAAKEAVAIARGDEPAASITTNGHTYRHVPEGSRILAPDQLDPYTIERCAEVAQRIGSGLGESAIGHTIATGIRALKGEK